MTKMAFFFNVAKYKKSPIFANELKSTYMMFIMLRLSEGFMSDHVIAMLDF